MGSSFNETWLQGTQSTNAATSAAQEDTNASNVSVATIQAQSYSHGADQQLAAQLDQDQTEKTIQMEALRIREKEVDNTYKLGVLQATNDGIRANASATSAAAQQTKADATYLKEENRHDEKTASQDSETSSYWYDQ